MTDAVLYAKHQQFADEDFLMKQFTTSNYYYMWPFKKSLLREIAKNRAAIRDERLHEKIIDANEILSSIDEKSEE